VRFWKMIALPSRGRIDVVRHIVQVIQKGTRVLDDHLPVLVINVRAPVKSRDKVLQDNRMLRPTRYPILLCTCLLGSALYIRVIAVLLSSWILMYWGGAFFLLSDVIPLTIAAPRVECQT